MICVKTGAYVHLICRGEWLRGDVFKTTKGDYVMRVCQRTRNPVRTIKHFTFHSYDIWFDETKTSTEQNSTLCAEGVQNYGHKGILI